MKNYWKNKNVAIAGIGGFLGSHFAEKLSEKEANVVGIYRKDSTNIRYIKKNYKKIKLLKFDLLDQKKLVENTLKIDTLINAAALDGNVEFKKKNSDLILQSNTNIAFSVLNAAKKNSIKNTALISSAEIYPDSVFKSKPREDNDYRKNFDDLENGYVISKRFMELIALLYMNQYKINVFLPRPTNMYGPRDKFNEANNRVIPSMITSILNSKKVNIWGNGKQIRSFIYVDDVVEATLKMIEKKKDNILNIASKESISIIDLAKKISNLSNNHLYLNIIKTQESGIKNRVLNSNKLLSNYDLKLTSLEEGLVKTLNWYRKVY